MEVICGSNQKTIDLNNDNSNELKYEAINRFYNDFWFNQKEFHKIEKGLYLGSDVPVRDPGAMKKLEINCIITVMEEPVPHKQRLNNITYIHFEAGDFPDEDLLSSFDNCFKLIYKSQTNNENIYIHCGSGMSRSATMVVAFLMRKYSLSMNDAINRVLKKRKIFPNRGFTEQLELYHKMNFFCNGYDREYRRFLLKTLTYQLRTDSPILHSYSQYYKYIEIRFNYETNCVRNYFAKISFAEQTAEQCGQSAPKGVNYCCYVCNTELFNEMNIIGDREDEDFSCNNLFIEPLQTYCTQSDTEKSGFLKCPNCLMGFGQYKWLLYQCDCPNHQQWRECLALKVRIDFNPISTDY